MKSYLYDVALSFAGEDRDYVRQIADLLRANGIRVFYDEFERANLWGKELIEYLEDIYKNKSKYVLVFVSKSYLTKDWTNHERKSALNRAFKNKEEYILPVKLDDTKLPGLHDSIGYLSAKNLVPLDICEIFLEKIGRPNVAKIQPSLLLYRITKKSFATDLSGQGATFGGRWNKKGTKVLYTSTSIALAVLETLSHSPSGYNLQNDYVIVQYTIPANLHIETVYESDLPLDWKSSPFIETTQEIGSNWVERNESCILSVPSAFVPSERNYLLNPENERYSGLKINKMDDFDINLRLLI